MLGSLDDVLEDGASGSLVNGLHLPRADMDPTTGTLLAGKVQKDKKKLPVFRTTVIAGEGKRHETSPTTPAPATAFHSILSKVRPFVCITLRFYDFRRGCALVLYQAGVPADIARTFLGHKPGSTTMEKGYLPALAQSVPVRGSRDRVLAQRLCCRATRCQACLLSQQQRRVRYRRTAKSPRRRGPGRGLWTPCSRSPTSARRETRRLRSTGVYSSRIASDRARKKKARAAQVEKATERRGAATNATAEESVVPAQDEFRAPQLPEGLPANTNLAINASLAGLRRLRAAASSLAPAPATHQAASPAAGPPQLAALLALQDVAASTERARRLRAIWQDVSTRIVPVEAISLDLRPALLRGKAKIPLAEALQLLAVDAGFDFFARGDDCDRCTNDVAALDHAKKVLHARRCVTKTLEDEIRTAYGELMATYGCPFAGCCCISILQPARMRSIPHFVAMILFGGLRPSDTALVTVYEALKSTPSSFTDFGQTIASRTEDFAS